MNTTTQQPATPAPSRLKGLVLQACILFMVAFSPVIHAEPVSLSLLGTTSYDGWINLSAAGGYTGVSFPGSGAWPTTGGNWTAYNPGSGNVGAIGSNTGGSGDALL